MRELSNYQKNIIETYTTTNKNIVVQAAPGSGKTTILLELLKFVSPIKRVIFLAFNKTIVDELKSRVPVGIHCKTLHSLGYSYLIQHYREKLVLNENKSFILCKKISKKWELSYKKEASYLFVIQDLCNIYRLTNCKTKDELIESAYRYNIDFEDDLHIDRAIECIRSIEEYNIKKTTKERLVDFVDMIYLPVFLRDKIEPLIQKYDEVFVDECQDLSIVQQNLINLILKDKGRFVVVGDSFQAIYSFLGADLNSFKNFEKRDNTVTLPLSITYRCAKSIVNEANGIFNNIEAYDKAPEGEIYNGTYKEVEPNDFILCRNNLPLIQMYLELIKLKKPCIIKGKDLGAGLLKLVLKIEDCGTQEAIFNLKEILFKLSEQLKEKGVFDPSKHPKYVEMSEKVEIIKYLIDQFKSISAVKECLQEMFSDKTKDKIVLSTVHKAKGLEAENVFILHEELIPSKYATQDWELIQEKNLYYVMLTRAKKKLVFIDDF